MEFTVEFNGADSWAEGIRDMARRQPGTIKEVMTSVAQGGKAFMDSVTPVRTGILRDGNTVEVTDDALTVSNAVPYFEFVNDGTRFMAPRPIWEPTLGYISDQLGYGYERSMG